MYLSAKARAVVERELIPSLTDSVLNRETTGVTETFSRDGILAARVLPRENWHTLREQHHRELFPLIQPHLERAGRGEQHPVLDFLFRYYSLRPQQLLTWGPGYGAILHDALADEFPSSLGYHSTPNGRTLDPASFPKKRLPFLEWVMRLNATVLKRSPRFSCFGLHEWAMLYRAPKPRHTKIPLRVSPSVIAEVVTNQPLHCTHFDAFRFFTPEAVPLNDTPLSREGCLTHEQPGCLHANMDLYKWCYKLYPWVSSDLLRASFLLALDARILDMEASPYDVTSLGYGAIAIESEEGKARYIESQRAIHEKAQIVRAALVAELSMLAAALAREEQSQTVSSLAGKS